MKKTLATLALILTATTAQADISNPTHKAFAEDTFHFVAPKYVIARACGFRTEARTMITVTTDFVNVVVSNDEIDRSMVNTIWMLEEMKAKTKTRKFVRAIEANPDHKKVVELCTTAKTAMKDIVAKFSKLDK